MNSSVSAVVLARDEEETLAECLETLGWADEVVVVVDDATRDGTEDIARRFTPHVYRRSFVNFSQQRNAALDLARSAWVLFVDADERVSAELANEVRATIAQTDGRGGFWIPRDNVICGRVVRHAGWWPDEQLRLLRRGQASFDPDRAVHEVAQVDGTTGHLRSPLLHLNYESLAEFCRKQARYSRLDAQHLYRRGSRPRVRSLVGAPAREFWRRYVALEGYREGWLGLVLSLLLAYYALATTLRLRRRWASG